MTAMKVKEAAEYMRLSHSTLNKWRVQGRGPRFQKIGRNVVYRKSDLDEWMDKQTRQSTSQDEPPWLVE